MDYELYLLRLRGHYLPLLLLLLVSASAPAFAFPSGATTDEPCVPYHALKQCPDCYSKTAPVCFEPSPPPPPPPKCPPPLPPPPPVSEELIQAYKTIQNFKKTLKCDPKGITKSWTGGAEVICSEPGVKYRGFYCEVPPGKTQLSIAAIDFNSFSLCSDAVGGFIASFPDVAVFHANSNNFTGAIPAAIAKLPFLYELDLSNNIFSGSFPSTLLALKRLRFLDIRYNQFSGAAPPAVFFSFPIIDVLFINNNRFVQSLPDNLGRTTAKYITLANNKFTGRIPRSIGDAANTLTEILLLNNQLCDCIPYEIGRLQKATVFDASQNMLKGTLPYSLACLRKVEQLNFAENQLRGSIPEVLCGGALGKLLNLNLSFNYFTELGPQCLKLAKKKVLDVSKNCIPGVPDQRPACDCDAFLCQPLRCPFPSTYRIIPCTLPRSAIQATTTSAIPKVADLSAPSSSSSPSKDATATYRAALHKN